MRIVTALAGLLLSLSVSANLKPLYTGSESQEGSLDFDGYVDIQSTTPPDGTIARNQIAAQTHYLVGNLQAGSEGSYGAVSYGVTLSQINIAANATATPSFRIHYHYSSHIVVPDGTTTDDFKFDLPTNPDLILEQSNGQCNSNPTEDLWYGFNPHLNGCALTEGKEFFVVAGELHLSNNMTASYPEYDHLVDPHNVIQMAVLLNYEIEDYRPFHTAWIKAGYTSHVWSSSEIITFLGFTPTVMPYVEDFSKNFAGKTVKIRLFYGNARIEATQDSKAFHYFYKSALETANVVTYEGHSGLGSNLNLDLIEHNENFKIHLKDGYQIYLLDGCISYSYYADQYLGRKATPADPRGSKNLDIITTGQESPGYDEVPATLLVDAVADWAETGTKESYQEMAEELNYSWFGVVGDEDNPTTP